MLFRYGRSRNGWIRMIQRSGESLSSRVRAYLSKTATSQPDRSSSPLYRKVTRHMAAADYSPTVKDWEEAKGKTRQRCRGMREVVTARAAESGVKRQPQTGTVSNQYSTCKGKRFILFFLSQPSGMHRCGAVPGTETNLHTPNSLAPPETPSPLPSDKPGSLNTRYEPINPDLETFIIDNKKHKITDNILLLFRLRNRKRKQ